MVKFTAVIYYIFALNDGWSGTELVTSGNDSGYKFAVNFSLDRRQALAEGVLVSRKKNDIIFSYHEGQQCT